MKWMQPRAKVQHLPVLADGQAAGFCGQSQGGGEKDTGAREICLTSKRTSYDPLAISKEYNPVTEPKLLMY